MAYKVLNGYVQELNEQQRSVVTLDDRVILCVAGAGTGKTKTLTHRVAHLVRNGISPSSILMLTFTNKASQEMLNRATVLLPESFRDSLNKLWGGTFHHAGSRIIRQFSEQLNVSKSFTIIDREDQNYILKEVSDDDEKKIPKPQSLIEVYSLATNTQLKTYEAIDQFFPHFAVMAEEIDSILNKYSQFKRERALLDFDDLLFYWWSLLKNHSEAVAWHKNKFLHVLVDEYQDTSKIQSEIVNFICKDPPTSLLIVGDEMQSIYSFRGATVDNIIRFQEVYKDAVVRKLEINYRSTPSILNLANEVTASDVNKYGKVLQPTKRDIEKPALYVCRGTREQARFVVERILELNKNYSLSEIAVLYRAHHHSIDVQLELQRMRIPFEVRSGLRFFEQAHIKDIVSFLRVLVNPLDELSLKRTLQLFDGIGKSVSAEIWGFVKVQKGINDNLTKFKLSKKAAEGIKRFTGIYKSSLSKDDPRAVVRFIYKDFYKEILKTAYDDYERRCDDVEAFINFITRFKNLAELLSELALSSYVSAERFGDSNERIVCTTVHQAKGLEWKVVFIIWLVDGKLPDARSKTEEEISEERRLFYVASTRAQDRLYMVMPAASFEYGGFKINRVSRFLEEVSESCYEKFSIEFDPS
ncbi:MAG: ATP-dependent helicase [Planctomycetes bacterium]|nr:ATP-dependent helicase [Planctomycetota bacterium]